MEFRRSRVRQGNRDREMVSQRDGKRVDKGQKRRRGSRTWGPGAETVAKAQVGGAWDRHRQEQGQGIR